MNCVIGASLHIPKEYQRLRGDGNLQNGWVSGGDAWAGHISGTFLGMAGLEVGLAGSCPGWGMSSLRADWRLGQPIDGEARDTREHL